MPSWKIVRTFPSKAEADIARQLLQSYGIEAQLRVRDGGDLYPQLQLMAGVDLLVKEEELESAIDVLDSP